MTYIRPGVGGGDGGRSWLIVNVCMHVVWCTCVVMHVSASVLPLHNGSAMFVCMSKRVNKPYNIIEEPHNLL